MPAPQRLPQPQPTLYPQRCFPAPQWRPLADLNDRLLARILATTVRAEQVTHRRPRTPCAVTNKPPLSLRQTTRKWSDVLGIWRHCEQPGCRGRGRCRGDSLACLPRYMPMLPAPVRLWFACVGIALEKNITFADAVAVAGRDGERAACARWHEAIRRALLSNL